MKLATFETLNAITRHTSSQIPTICHPPKELSCLTAAPVAGALTTRAAVYNWPRPEVRLPRTRVQGRKGASRCVPRSSTDPARPSPAYRLKKKRQDTSGDRLAVLALATSYGADDERPEPLELSSSSRRFAGPRNLAEWRNRSSQGTRIEPKEKDFVEAANFGLKAMNDLYHVKEPKLYSMGLFLSPTNPARYVAAFNDQSAEAKHLAKYGFAALEAAKKIRSKFPDISRQSSISQTNGQSILGQQCPKKGIPQCPPASLKYRTSDGSCNNLKELWWGSAMSTMQRFLPSAYDDGIESIRRSVTGNPLPSARQVSDHIHEERDAPLISVTHMLMQWGQFIDHDITATGQSTAFNDSVPQCCLNGGLGFQPSEFMHPDCLPIAVHPHDRHLSKLSVRCLEFVRSGPAPRENCDFGPREQLSQVTSFIDASTVYSSSARRCDSLRIFRNGLMQYGKIQSRRPVLPRDDSDLCRRGSLSTSCFRAGDGRLSEQPALISLHVIFLRMHNRLATLLSALNQHWSDEKIFQETRKIVGALVQHITYREFLPIVLGDEVMKIFDIEPLRKGYYRGYDQLVNPNIANAFSSAAYRFGHSLVQRSFIRFDRHHRPILNNVTIHEEFSNPVNLETAGSVDRILLGLINQPSQKRDEFISDELTNHLFQTPGFPFGMDLASLNIQRGRDHGIPPFVEWRIPCMLSPIRNWKELERIMVPETARKFKDLYTAVEDIDLFSAGLAERPVVGGLIGATFACIIAQQFRSLRKGDRFWYENPFIESSFTPKQLQQIRKVTLAQVLCRTLDNIDNIQPFVMLAADNIRNKRLNCDDPILDQINLDPWIENPLQQRESSVTNESTYDDDEEKIESNADDRDTESRVVSIKKFNQRVPQRQNPVRSTINQQNRIVVKRPIGPGENITIIVNNHAVHSPIIIRDSMYGSNINIDRPLNSDIGPNQSNIQSNKQNPTTVSENFIELIPTTQKSTFSQRPYNSLKPSHLYYPHNFQDHNNPNPPNYGLNAKPLNNYYPNNEFFSYNLPNLINTVSPQRQQDSFHESQEGFYFVTKKTIPRDRPSSKPQLGQNNFYEHQQQSYISTKKPNLSYRPNIKLTSIAYNQGIESNLPSKLQGSYNHLNDKSNENFYSSQINANNPYINWESSKSDRVVFNPNYQNFPTKKIAESPQNYSNRRNTEKSPLNKESSNSHEIKHTSKGPIRYNSWRNSNSPTQLYSLSNSLSNSSNNKPLQNTNHNFYTHLLNSNNLDLNYNLEKKEIYHQMLNYLQSHTTESVIKSVLIEKQPQEQISNVHKELPKPLITLQNREFDECKNVSKSVIPVEHVQLVQNFSKHIESVFKNKDQNTKNIDTNERTNHNELKSTTAAIMTDGIEILLQPSVQKIFGKNLSKIINDTTTIYSKPKVPAKILIEYETSITNTSNELPRPIKMRHGN
ncbi:PREDICTED: uncharacterized protein LOC105366506 [Ceratosolen solmsi marchali]|uniref:Uncharacterized protein LOC105366506 n=1 Tax=Ceratosolen solmsi marchali TaxID=326594 RepID=A0AAJ6YS71_9HYME|nr:PREDICTED: uncharacterized protein LOC105366506 [Ceratosolen solmsi marchali]